MRFNNFFYFGSLLILCSCGENISASDTIGKGLNGFKSASLNGKTLEIQTDIGMITSEELAVWQVGKYLKPIGIAVKRGAPESKDALTLNIVFFAETKDKLGNKASAKLMAIKFDANELRAANYDNLNEFDMLNLATGVESTNFGDLAITSNCMGKNGEFTLEFCQTFLDTRKK